MIGLGYSVPGKPGRRRSLPESVEGGSGRASIMIMSLLVCRERGSGRALMTGEGHSLRVEKEGAGKAESEYRP